MGMVPKQKNNSKNPPKLNSMGSGVGTVLVAKDPSLLVCWAHCWGGTEELIRRVLYPDPGMLMVCNCKAVKSAWFIFIVHFLLIS